MRQVELGISLIELQRVAALAMGLEIDPLIKSALRIGLVTVIAIELLAVHRRNVIGEMPAVVEPQSVWVPRFLPDKLELRVSALVGCLVKRGEGLRVSELGTRQVENDLLRRMRSEMKRVGRQRCPFWADAS